MLSQTPDCQLATSDHSRRQQHSIVQENAFQSTVAFSQTDFTHSKTREP